MIGTCRSSSISMTKKKPIINIKCFTFIVTFTTFHNTFILEPSMNCRVMLVGFRLRRPIFYWASDATKDVLYLTTFLCSMLSPGLLNPDVSCMFNLILAKHHPQIPLVDIPTTRLPYPDPSWKYDKLASFYEVLRIKPFPNV